MKKPSIPPSPLDSSRNGFDKSVKECLESIMGRRGNSLKKLDPNASLSDVINTVNSIIDQMQ